MKRFCFNRFTTSLCLSWIALASLYAGPGYRYASGHKVLIWNDLPAQDSIVTWSGARDDQGYATGPGTLSFFQENWAKYTTGSNIPHGKPVLVRKLTGTMVKGKFTGMVSLSMPAGAYSHVKYADGSPSGKWLDGPAPEVKSKKALAEKSASPIEKAERESPAEGPSPAEAIATSKSAGDTPVEIVRGSASPGSESLRSLTAPPSSLPKNDAKLSRAEAIRNADEQAITAGFNVGEYQSRKVSYDAGQARWTVSYEQAGGSDSSDPARPKHFTINVDDKTGQASLAPAN